MLVTRHPLLKNGDENENEMETCLYLRKVARVACGAAGVKAAVCIVILSINKVIFLINRTIYFNGE